MSDIGLKIHQKTSVKKLTENKCFEHGSRATQVY